MRAHKKWYRFMLQNSDNDRLKKNTILSVYSVTKLLPPMTDQDKLEKMSVYSGVIKT